MKLYITLFCLLAFGPVFADEFRSLNQGWNLVSLPIREDIAVTDYLSTHVTGSVSMIFAADKDWLIYTESEPAQEFSTYEQFDTFKPGFAYWLRMNESGKLYFNSLAPEVPTTSDPGSAPSYVDVVSSSNSPVVSFYAVAEAQSYNLYYHSEDEMIVEKGNRVSNIHSPFQFNLPNRDTKYFAVVTSLKDGVESPASEVMVIDPLVETSITSPSIVAHSSTTTTISVVLNKVSAVDQYNLYYSKDSKLTKNTANRLTGSTEFLELLNLEPNTNYYLAATSIQDNKESDFSTIVTRLTKQSQNSSNPSTSTSSSETSIDLSDYTSSEEIFTLDTGGPIHSNPMIGPNGVLYVGSTDGYLYAMSKNGSLKWKVKTNGFINTSIVGDMITTPNGEEFRIYAYSEDKNLYSIDESGNIVWKVFVGNCNLSAPAIAADHTIYIASQATNTHNAQVTAISPDGEELWAFRNWHTIFSAPTIDEMGILYISSGFESTSNEDTYFISAIYPDGSLKWSKEIDGIEYLPSDPVINHIGEILIGVDDKVNAYDMSNGDKLWDYQGASAFSSIVMDSNNNYYLLSESKLTALGTDHSLRWEIELEGSSFSPPSIGDQNIVYLSSATHKLQAIDSEGKILWTNNTKSTASPVIDDDGVLYLGGIDGFIHTIKTDSLGLSDSWSKRGGNLLNNRRTKNAKAAGDIFETSSGMKMSWIPPGSVSIGSTSTNSYFDEGPAHKVSLTKGFWLGQVEVTLQQWQTMMGTTPDGLVNHNPNSPITGVSWSEAKVFIELLNEMEGRHSYRLPTEVEFEYSSKAGRTSDKPWLDVDSTLDQEAWFTSNSVNTTQNVGLKNANAFGLSDMSGNVSEWTEDWYGSDVYKDHATSDAVGPNTGSRKVVRGCSYQDSLEDCRVSRRDHYSVDTKSNKIGFRVLKEFTNDTYTPEQVSDVVVTEEDHSLKVTFASNAKAQWYNVYFRLQTQELSAFTVVKTNENLTKLYNLQNDVPYEIKVSAGNFTGGEGAYSDLVVASPKSPEILLASQTLTTNTSDVTHLVIGTDSTIYTVYTSNQLHVYGSDLQEKWIADLVGDSLKPIPAESGTLYLATQGLTRDNNMLYHFDDEGNVKWKRQTGGKFSSPKLSQDGFLYIASNKITDNYSNYVYKFDNQGTPVWKFKVETSISSIDVTTSGLIYIHAADRVSCITNGGTLLWNYYTSTIIEGDIFADSFDNIYLNGDERISINKLGKDSFSLDEYNKIIFGENKVAFGLSDQRLTQISKDGEKIWTHDFEVNVDQLKVSENGTIFVNYGNRLMKLDSNGTIQWVSSEDQVYDRLPVEGADNKSYVVDQDNNISIFTN
ncbi:MAG: SUMF1/EgtB/PvdO family nonheme iron enzyme [Candidatus Cloacimonetes bacterium]|nr:SUMF1/EgtB/PvdO family nonheme iron enzyme [Candidatus Cloacimonadota bacterium]